MPRRSRPWHCTERNWWYVTIDGKRTRLGVRGDGPGAEAEAHAAWKQLLQAAQQLQTIGAVNLPAAPDPRTRRTVGEVIASYLTAPDLDVAATTRDRMRWSLAKFAAAVGDMPADALTARQVETALPAALSASSRHGAIGDLLTCLSWAGVRVPGRVRRPPKESRGADCVLTPEQYQRVQALATGDLRGLIVVLWETGCRPGEAAAMTAESVDWSAGVVRLKAHKTRRHTGRDRIIPLTPTALGTLDAQRATYRTGHLFRTTTGRPFDRQRVNQRFQDLARRAGFKVIAYGFRHSFATHALAAGVPEAHVAAALGHTSTAMIARHYGHVSEMMGVLKAAAARVSAARTA